MTTGQWFWTLVILAVPLLNIIMFIVWALGSGNRSRVTYCRASMLIVLIGVVIYAVIFGLALIAGSAAPAT